MRILRGIGLLRLMRLMRLLIFGMLLPLSLLHAQPPLGELTSLTSDGIATGWSLDLDSPHAPIWVEFYVDDPHLPQNRVGRTLADIPTEFHGKHGFVFSVPPQLLTQVHRLFVLAVDTNARGQKEGYLVNGAPQEFGKLSTSALVRLFANSVEGSICGLAQCIPADKKVPLLPGEGIEKPPLLSQSPPYSLIANWGASVSSLQEGLVFHTRRGKKLQHGVNLSLPLHFVSTLRDFLWGVPSQSFVGEGARLSVYEEPLLKTQHSPVVELFTSGGNELFVGTSALFFEEEKTQQGMEHPTFYSLQAKLKQIEGTGQYLFASRFVFEFQPSQKKEKPITLHMTLPHAFSERKERGVLQKHEKLSAQELHAFGLVEGSTLLALPSRTAPLQPLSFDLQAFLCDAIGASYRSAHSDGETTISRFQGEAFELNRWKLTQVGVSLEASQSMQAEVQFAEVQLFQVSSASNSQQSSSEGNRMLAYSRRCVSHL